MNIYRFSSTANHAVKVAIAEALSIKIEEVYSKTVSISPKGIVVVEGGRLFKLKLEPVIA